MLRTALAVVSGLVLSTSVFGAEPTTNKQARSAEIRLAENEPGGELIEATVAGSADKIFLHQTPLATSDDIAEVAVVIDSNGNPAIAVSFTTNGAKAIAAATEQNLGKRLAVVVDGKVISAPIIRSKIGRKAQVAGNFSVKEAMRIRDALSGDAIAREPKTKNASEFIELFNGRDLTGWVDVNTSPETWQVKDGLLVCTGKPIGVMRSEKQYENFLLHIEWRHMKPGGNSGVFVWSEGAIPSGRRLPKGMEVQMLELEWVNLNRKSNGERRDLGYISGELFGAGGLKATPDNPRGSRSKSIELRCNGAGEWNFYDVVCVDGTVKLSINGKFVNSIRDSSVRKGYLCLESEGSEIHFRNIRILELPSGVASPETTAKVVE